MTARNMTARNPLILSLAVAAALAAPMAFAQSANADANAQEHSSTQATEHAPLESTTPATPATPSTPAMAQQDETGSADTMGATPATPAAPAQPAAGARKVTWSDLDGDHDGKLSKTEAAPIEALSQVFDEADADADGALTADEYKTYLAANGKAGNGNGG